MEILKEEKVRKLNLLAIGDNRDFLSAFRPLLEKKGLEIFTTETGNSAIILAEKLIPELIILNPDLPDISGFQFLRTLKMRNNTWNIPVLLCSSRFLTPDEIQDCLDLGINDYISPSIREGELLIKIESLTRLKRAEDKIHRLYLERTKELEWSNFELEKIRTELILKSQLATIGRLVATTTHEIKTPASSILGNLETIPDLLDGLIGNISHILSCSSHPLIEDIRYLFERLRRYDFDRIIPFGEVLLNKEIPIRKTLSEIIRDEESLKFMTRWIVKFHLDEDPLSIQSILSLLKSGNIGLLKLILSFYEIFLKLGNMKKSVERIMDTLRTMKSYSYMTRGETEVDINKGIEETLSILSYHLKGEISIIKRYHPLLPTIRAIPGEINQIWTNILTNSYDALSGKGEITIVTDLVENSENGGSRYIKVSITDNGPGIPKEILPHIFTPFFTTKVDGKGIGLGLDITKMIVEKYRGKIEVSSQPGKTTFTVLIPVNKGE